MVFVRSRLHVIFSDRSLFPLRAVDIVGATKFLTSIARASARSYCLKTRRPVLYTSLPIYLRLLDDVYRARVSSVHGCNRL